MVGMAMSDGFLSTASDFVRYYSIGDGVQGAVEVLPANFASASPGNSYIYAGSDAYGAAGGLGLTIWGQSKLRDANLFENLPI